MKEKEIFCPASREEWREWLEAHYPTKTSVWLKCYKKETGIPSLSWSEAVDEALCFGWIDSVRNTLDEHSFIQFFSKRKPKGTWSKVNKAKVEVLIAEGRMTEAGLQCIEQSKQNGSWTILDEIEELTLPKDLWKAFHQKKGSFEFYESLSKSLKKAILQWLVMAKQPETRQRRITEIVECAQQQLKPRHLR